MVETRVGRRASQAPLHRALVAPIKPMERRCTMRRLIRLAVAAVVAAVLVSLPTVAQAGLAALPVD
jgi:hypothetical protein